MRGLLLINLGTPDAPTPAAVRRYLRAFLSDPRVIDLSGPARWLLLNLVILPFRPKASARAYRQIWSEQGSPLLLHGRSLRSAVAARLGEGWKVALGMRYGKPSLASALEGLLSAGVRSIVALPLYPQQASSTTGSSLEALYRLAAAQPLPPVLSVVPPFFRDEGYLRAQASLLTDTMKGQAIDHVLFSFHGLPERQLRRADPTGHHCLATPGCCETESPAQQGCYRHQCRATAAALAKAVGLPESRWSTAYQSRLGRTPWLAPSTESVLAALPGEGKKRVAVMSASFVADCLETLEELGIRGRQTFEAAGGEALLVVPALNAGEAWVDAVAALARGCA